MGNEQASGANDFYSHGGAGRFAASGGLGRASVFSADRGRGPPPVSANKISKYLAPINVTADDLLEESNKECAICLQEQTLGDPACKLPCGHLFHVECVEGWLRLHCTCPVCRYELETDDKQYEQERKSRMKNRKQRYRLDELNKKSISALKEMMITYGIKDSGCVDKRDLIERLILSKHIELVEGVPTIDISYEELDSKNVRELKELMLSFGIPTDGVLEKKELVTRLIESGRVNVSSVPEASTYNESEESNSNQEFEIRGILHEKSVKDLCKLLKAYNINAEGVLEKHELVCRFVQSGVTLQETVIFFNNFVEPDPQPKKTKLVEQAAASHDHPIAADYKEVCPPSSDSFTFNGSEPTNYGESIGCSSQSRFQYAIYGDSSGTTLSIKELKGICVAMGININDCFDKNDILEKLKSSGVELS